jgi:L-cystine uptake protein TcyP (sodium:dicarboxylate symporter family)
LNANRKILIFEIVGAIFIVLFGATLHFTFTLSGNNPIVAWFSAVNESVWEHLKMVFWPSLIWSLIEAIPLKNASNNFFTAKALGIYAMVLFIPTIFYSYTAFTKESYFIIDISSFVIAVIIGQLVSYKSLNYRLLNRAANKIGILAIIVLAVCFIVFTFYPPQLPIFQDSTTGLYGFCW